MIEKTKTTKVRKRSPHRGGARRSFVFRNGNGNGTYKKPIPPPKPGVVRVIALGGFAEVGRNMMLFETERDILIIDIGLQFPDENMHGIDYIIPNISYLENKKDKIRGVIITHGHYDHIGAIPQLIGKLGNPTLYATRLTAAIVKKRQEDYPHSSKLDIEYIDEKSVVKLGDFVVRFFPVMHNIPEGVGLEIETPAGLVVHPGEFKFYYDRDYKPMGLEHFQALGKKNVRLLMLDSTNAEEPNRSVPEPIVEDNIEELLQKAEGRVIISTFASLIDRLTQIIHIADKLGRKVAITGRSMQTNFAISQELGLVKLKRKTIIPIKEIGDHPDNKVLILTTGAQGEERAGLTRMASGTHREVQIKKGDTIIFSSSIVPGNEMYVQTLRDNLARQGAIVYHYKIFDIHSGGHAKRIELKETMEMVKPQCFLPIHGFYYMRTVNAKLAEETGIKKENIVVPDNGQILELTKNSITVLAEKVPTNYVMVDGLGIGDVKEVVLRDRQMLAEDGIFVIIAVVDAQSGKVRGSPDIISRGFVYLRESRELLHQTRGMTKKIVENATQNMHPINWDWVKNGLRDEIGKFLFQKTHRRPMVLPVVIEV